jgi:hypothetical protein
MAYVCHCLQLLRTCAVCTMAYVYHCLQFLHICALYSVDHSCDTLRWGREPKSRRTARSESVTVIFHYDGVKAKSLRMSPLYFILYDFSLQVCLPGEIFSLPTILFCVCVCVWKVSFRVAVTTCNLTQWIAEWGGNGIWHHFTDFQNLQNFVVNSYSPPDFVRFSGQGRRPNVRFQTLTAVAVKIVILECDAV